MKLEEIGFYTLSDERAKNSTHKTPLQRCEMILTDRCNFNCPYCRGLKEGFKGDIAFAVAKKTIQVWLDNGLKNVRFSGGEPTLHPDFHKIKSPNLIRITLFLGWEFYGLYLQL